MVGLRDFYVVAPASSFHPSAMAAHHEHFLPNAAPCLIEDDHRSSKIHLWQSPHSQPLLPSPQVHVQPRQEDPNPNSTTFSYFPKPPHSPAQDSSGILFVAGGPSSCQDCGNQAKKGCSHGRCRTCCKGRGFDCSTHIKSTWVSAARRRERHISASDSALKKPRLFSSQTSLNATTSHASNSNTPPRSFDTGSSLQGDYLSFRESLPGHVRAPAVFRCVRVTSIDEGEDEYAYHAKVSIGGHVFKGFLYNQGFDGGGRTDLTGTSTAVHVNNNVSNASSAIPNFSDLHLGGGGVRNVPHPDIYGLGGLLGGTAFGNAIN